MVDLLKHCVIPVLVIGLNNTCGLIRTMRSQMLDELNKNYVMTGKAKGMKAKAIRYKYCVRAAVNPIASSIGWSLVGIFTGTTITAIVLNLPSMGTVMYNALIDQDMYLAGSWLFLMAIVTVIGMELGGLFSGSVLTETIFAWPGVGKYIVDGINNSDYAVVQGGCMLVAIISVLMNLLVDLLYGTLDPRIRY